MAESRSGNARRGRRFGLLARIALALAMVGLLPIAAVSLQLVRVNRGAMRDRVLQTHIVAARTTADRAASSLASLAAVADAVAGNPEVIADTRSPAVRELLAGLLQARSDLTALVLLTNDGGEILRVQRRGRGDAVDEALLSSSADGPSVAKIEDGLLLVMERALDRAGGQARLGRGRFRIDRGPGRPGAR